MQYMLLMNFLSMDENDDGTMQYMLLMNFLSTDENDDGTMQYMPLMNFLITDENIMFLCTLKLSMLVNDCFYTIVDWFNGLMSAVTFEAILRTKYCACVQSTLSYSIIQTVNPNLNLHNNFIILLQYGIRQLWSTSFV